MKFKCYQYRHRIKRILLKSNKENVTKIELRQEREFQYEKLSDEKKE